MPRIRDWSDYVATIQALLDPDAPPLSTEIAPRVRIVHTINGCQA
jgi:hypothetical protein